MRTCPAHLALGVTGQIKQKGPGFLPRELTGLEGATALPQCHEKGTREELAEEAIFNHALLPEEHGLQHPCSEGQKCRLL